MNDKTVIPEDGLYEVSKGDKKMTYLVKDGVLYLPLPPGKTLVPLNLGEKGKTKRSFMRAKDAIDECGTNTEAANDIREFATSKGLQP